MTKTAEAQATRAGNGAANGAAPTAEHASLAEALLAAQIEMPPVDRDQENPQMMSVPSDQCPSCGGPKIVRAKRCKVCHNEAQRGVPKTTTPSIGASRYRARQLCSPGPCSYGGCSDPGTDVHHIDGDPFNNGLANLARMCRRHHMVLDGRLAAARGRAARVGKKFGGRPKEKTA